MGREEATRRHGHYARPRGRRSQERATLAREQECPAMIDVPSANRLRADL